MRSVSLRLAIASASTLVSRIVWSASALVVQCWIDLPVDSHVM